MTELSRQARRALEGLRKESRSVQRNGEVLSSRRITECADALREDLERLEKDRKQFLEQITNGRTAEQELMGEVVELRVALEEAEE